MKKIYFLLATLVGSIYNVSAQSYFQQSVNYQIEVALDDEEHTLKGSIKIEYTNNSPEALTEIWFHLWPNAYKNQKTALAKQLLANGETAMHYADNDDLGYMDSLYFMVNNQPVQLIYHHEHTDIAKLVLTEPLKPGSKIEISTPFLVKIPSSNFSRLGHGGTSYQLTQWYPKPAVYDQLGWHAIPYLDQGEFYSEFGSFDVKITLPANYVVAATGELQTQKEIAYLNQLAANPVLDKDEIDFRRTKTDSLKTLHYTAEKVHDFAIFTDKQYRVAKSSVKLPGSNREVTTWAFYTSHEEELWQKATDYINDALYYYSLWNGDYPYNNCTAVSGALSAGAGMEYPGITVIGTSGSAMSLEEVIMHEVGHNWFYGVLAFNERMYPWMDEGMNLFCELRYMETKFPKAKLADMLPYPWADKFLDLNGKPYGDMKRLSYLYSVRKNEDQATNLSADKFTNINYGTIVYYKTAVAFNYFRHVFGNDVTDHTLKTLYNEWQFKHPYPNDVRKIFERETTANLSWLFDDLIGSNKVLDYKLSSFKKNKVTIKNSGDIAAPVFISALSKGNVVYETWMQGFSGKQTVEVPAETDVVLLDRHRIMPEYTHKNNRITNRKFLSKAEPFKLKFLGGFENDLKTVLYFIPTVGYNTTAGLMPGITLHNGVFPQSDFEWNTNLAYSFNTKLPQGGLNYRIRLLRNAGIFKNMWYTGNVWSYAREQSLIESVNIQAVRFRTGIEMQLKNSNPRNGLATFIKPEIFMVGFTDQAFDTYNFGTFGVQHFINKTLNNLHIKAEAAWFEHADRYTIELNYAFNYKQKGKKFEARLFAGLTNGNAANYFASLSLNAVNAATDYKFAETFIGGLSSKFWDSQMVPGNGNFFTPTPYNENLNKLLALTIKTSLPAVPLKLYANMAWVPKSEFYSNNLQFETGLELQVISKFLSVYFPVAFSKDIADFHVQKKFGYLKKVGFMLNFDAANPFYLIRNL